MAVFSMLFGLFVIVNRIFPRFTVVGYWVGANPGVATLLCFLTFVFSILFICMGIIGEYLIVLLQEVKQRPTGIVQMVVGEARKNESASNIAVSFDNNAAEHPSPTSVSSRLFTGR
jgi:dolichol-phosphate mannosyltransferase